MTVELPAQFEALVKRLVSAGDFASESDVLVAALRLLEAQGGADDSAQDHELLRLWAKEGFDQLDTGDSTELNVSEIVSAARRRYLG